MPPPERDSPRATCGRGRLRESCMIVINGDPSAPLFRSGRRARRAAQPYCRGIDSSATGGPPTVARTSIIFILPAAAIAKPARTRLAGSIGSHRDTARPAATGLTHRCTVRIGGWTRVMRCGLLLFQSPNTVHPIWASLGVGLGRNRRHRSIDEGEVNHVSTVGHGRSLVPDRLRAGGPEITV